MKHLLIVYHSQSGTNARLAEAVLRGALQECDVETRLLRAGEAGTTDLLWADAVLFGAAENFGYLAGGMTDFLARTFYPAQLSAQTQPRSWVYALFMCTGNDGRSAVRQLQRIAGGYPMREVAEPIIVRGDIDDAALVRCEELGLTLAAGLALGIF
ncbi:MAG TPA: flavodoxin [Spongiibacteraceae bacterium]|nr:flavodoxin [Spongiibacteraceae bacterium]